MMKKTQQQHIWFNKPVFYSMAALAVASTITACSSIISKAPNDGNNNTLSSVSVSPPVVETVPEKVIVVPEVVTIGEEIFLRCRQEGNTDRYVCVREKDKKWNPFK